MSFSLIFLVYISSSMWRNCFKVYAYYVSLLALKVYWKYSLVVDYLPNMHAVLGFNLKHYKKQSNYTPTPSTPTHHSILILLKFDMVLPTLRTLWWLFDTVRRSLMQKPWCILGSKELQLYAVGSLNNCYITWKWYER